MYRLYSLIISLLLLVSCSKDPTVITVSLASKKKTENLDTRLIQYTAEFYLLENLTSRLVSLDESGEYKLDLAESIVELNELEYQLKIKENYFSNGERIRLEDVKASFERIVKYGSSHINFRNDVERIDIVGDVLKVKFKKKSKSFFYYLSLPDLGILHKTQYSKENLTASDYIPVASGPFSYFYDGHNYYLVKNTFYKLGSLDYPDKVKLVSPFRNDAMEMTLKGELDLGQVSLKNYLSKRDMLIGKNFIRVIGVPSDMLTYIFFNDKSPNFKNVDHRRWLRTVIDKHFAVTEEFQDIARRTKQYFPSESKAFLNDETVDDILKDVYLKDKPKDFPETVNIYTFTTAFDVSIESLIQKLQSNPEIKINVINSIEPLEYIEKLNSGEIDIFLTMMSTDFRTPIEAINFEFFTENSVLKDKNKLIRKNFDKYLTTRSEYEEVKSLKEISKIILKSDQIIPLYHNAIPFVYNTSKVNLEGLSHLFIFNFWKIKKNQ